MGDSMPIMLVIFAIAVLQFFFTGAWVAVTATMKHRLIQRVRATVHEAIVITRSKMAPAIAQHLTKVRCIAVAKAFAETFVLYAPEFWSPQIKEMLGRSIGVTLASVLNQIKIEGDS